MYNFPLQKWNPASASEKPSLPDSPNQGLQIRILHYNLELKILQIMSEFEYSLSIRNVEVIQLQGAKLP